MKSEKIQRLVHPRTGHIVIVSNGVMRYEHRLVWEKHHGKIPHGMCIHHKNENPQDNRISNLEIKSFGEHSRFHQGKSNSFAGKTHTIEFKKMRSSLYSGSGNPNFLSNVSTDEIVRLRKNGMNWCQISRCIGIDRGTARKRFLSVKG